MCWIVCEVEDVGEKFRRKTREVVDLQQRESALERGGAFGELPWILPIVLQSSLTAQLRFEVP